MNLIVRLQVTNKFHFNLIIFGNTQQNTGLLDDMSMAKESFKNPNSTRPIIARIPDHDHILKVLNQRCISILMKIHNP